MRRAIHIILIVLFTSVAAWGVSQLPELQVDNININGNTISSTSGNIALTPTSDLAITGNTTTTGTIDGRDVAADGVILDSLDSILGDITSAEADQIENIDSVTISNTQWGYLGVLDQSLVTTDTPTFDGLILTDPMTLSHETTPSNPSSGNVKVYAKNDDTLYVLNSSGTETAIGAGGGSGLGGITYFPDFEADDTSNVTTYDDGAANPVDGTGGTVDYLTVSSETSVQLSGDASYKIAKSANDAQGEGFAIASDNFYRLEKVGPNTMVASFSYETSTNYASGDVTIWYYLIGSNEIHQCVGTTVIGTGPPTNELLKADDGSDYKCLLNATSSDTNLRFIFHVASTNATAYDVYVDRTKLAPDELVPGFIGSEWETATVTDSWTNSTVSAKKRRVGDSAEYEVTVQLTGTPASTTVLDLTLDETVDESKISQSNDRPSIGAAFLFDSGTAGNRQHGQVFFYQPGNTVRVLADGASVVTNTSPFSFVSGDYVSFKFTVPIEGWKSGALFSSAAVDYKNVDVRGSGNGGTSITASTTNLDFTEVSDELGAWSGSQFTVPADGKYVFTGAVGTTASQAATMYLYIDGTIDIPVSNNPTATTIKTFHAEKYLEKDQVVGIRSDTGFTLFNSINHYLSIASVQDTSKHSEYRGTKKTQIKYLTADITTNTTMSDLTFSNLVVGQWYEVDLHGRAALTAATTDNVDINIEHDGSKVARQIIPLSFNGAADLRHTSAVFQATTTTLTFVSASVGGSSVINGNSSKDETWAQLKEIEPLVETTEW